jgi:hypothetical protein
MGSGLIARTVTISEIGGDGILGISIAPGTAADLVGNLALAAGPSTTFAVANAPPIWVDFNYTGPETGSEAQPFNTVLEAITALIPGGIIRMRAGSTSETLRLSKPSRLEAVGGPVRIGRAPAEQPVPPATSSAKTPAQLASATEPTPLPVPYVRDVRPHKTSDSH